MGLALPLYAVSPVLQRLGPVVVCARVCAYSKSSQVLGEPSPCGAFPTLNFCPMSTEKWLSDTSRKQFERSLATTTSPLLAMDALWSARDGICQPAPHLDASNACAGCARPMPFNVAPPLDISRWRPPPCPAGLTCASFNEAPSAQVRLHRGRHGEPTSGTTALALFTQPALPPTRQWSRSPAMACWRLSARASRQSRRLRM